MPKARKKHRETGTVSWRVLSVFIAIGVIFLAQMIWWIIFFITNISDDKGNRYTRMIITEGGFFIVLIFLGLAIIYRILRHEIALKQQFKDFFSSFSHELKTPIASVKLQLETMQAHTLEEEQRRKLLGNMLEDMEKLELSLDNILDAFSYEAEAINLEKTPTDFDDWLRMKLEEARRLHDERSLQLVSSIDSGAVTDLDDRYMSSVVSNLVQNSVRYSREGAAKVNTEVKLQGKRILWIYEDSGLGIDPAEAEDIFEKFYRSDKAHALKHKGSGIGLYLTRKIIEGHGGRILAQPRESGQGIRFEIRLPARESNG
jgi:signal transduction histidine kinase